MAAVAACPSTPDASQRGFRGSLLPASSSIRCPPASEGTPPTNASQHTPLAATPFTPIASQRGFRGRLLPTFSPIHRPPAGAGATTTHAHRHTTAAVPSTPCASQRGFRGPAACSSTIEPAHRFAQFDTPRATQPPLAFQRAPASRHRIRPDNSDVRGAASAPGSPPPSACHAGCFRSLHVERHTASRPRAPAAKPTPVEPRTPPDRFVRARLRCSSRASLPLTPQAGTPTATIGMRPATSLRTKTKSVNGLLRAVGRFGFSYASTPARVPTALKMLSQEQV